MMKMLFRFIKKSRYFVNEQDDDYHRKPMIMIGNEQKRLTTADNNV